MAVVGLTLSIKQYLKLLKKDREAILFKKFYLDPESDQKKRLPYGARCLALAMLDKPMGSKVILAKLARKFKVPNSLVSRWVKQLRYAGLFIKSASGPRKLSKTT